MSWRSARAGLDAALSSRADGVAVEFSGGEPLIEVRMLRRAVEYVDAALPPGAKAAYSVTTNGTLLSDPVADDLLARGFTIRISCDGVAAAQRLRGEGTFEVVDALLDRLRRRNPGPFARQVRAVMTLLGATVPHLADGVRYLIAKGVAAIDVGPCLTQDPGWRPSRRDELERQLGEVVEASLDHWRATGRIPVSFLAGAPPRGAVAPVDRFLCGAPLGSALCVDPGGRAWACPMFASSMLPLRLLAAQASRALDLGVVGSPAFERRLASLPERAGRLRLFTGRLAKRSSYGACADCRFVSDCRVCPAAISHGPAGDDPDRISDGFCAFRMATLAARERFEALTRGGASAAWRG